jgi:hypothetical protein
LVRDRKPDSSSKRSKKKRISSNDLRDEEWNLEVFKLLLQPEYEPPYNPVGILAHLFSLCLFYSLLSKEMDEFPLIVAMRLDFALTKLVRSVYISISEFENIDLRGRRTGKTAQTKREFMKELIEIATTKHPGLLEEEKACGGWGFHAKAKRYRDKLLPLHNVQVSKVETTKGTDTIKVPDVGAFVRFLLDEAILEAQSGFLELGKKEEKDGGWDPKKKAFEYRPKIVAMTARKWNIELTRADKLVPCENAFAGRFKNIRKGYM